MNILLSFVRWLFAQTLPHAAHPAQRTRRKSKRADRESCNGEFTIRSSTPVGEGFRLGVRITCCALMMLSGVATPYFTDAYCELCIRELPFIKAYIMS